MNAPLQTPGIASVHRVATVIVTFNRVELLRQCLEAVFKQDREIHLVILVDNASTDGTADFVAHLQVPRHTELKYIRMSTNTGGAGGFAAGMREGVHAGATHLWIMDDDCIPVPNALRKLFDAVSCLGDDVFVGSNIFDTAGESANVLPVSLRPGSNGFPQFPRYLSKGYLEIESLSFVSILIPVHLVAKVGLPFAKYFLWADDVEYSLRLRTISRGYLVGDSSVTHLKAGDPSFRIEKEESINRIKLYYFFYRNTLYTVRSHSGWFSKNAVQFMLRSLADIRRAATARNHVFLRIRTILSGLWCGVFFKCDLEFVDSDAMRSDRVPHCNSE